MSLVSDAEMMARIFKEAKMDKKMDDLIDSMNLTKVIKEFVIPAIKEEVIKEVRHWTICAECGKRWPKDLSSASTYRWPLYCNPKHSEVCPVCRGKGKVPSVICSDPLAEAMEINHETCHGCGGRGWVEVG